MKYKVPLIIISLLSILLFTFHWTDDIVRGFAPGGFSGFGGILILLVWLIGTLVLPETRVGCIIMLLGSILGVVALALHMRGLGLVGGRIAHSSGVFFWVWTLITLGASASLSGVLSVLAFWSLQRNRSRS
jgi:membrane-bound ClpP family serine protease